MFLLNFPSLPCPPYPSYGGIKTVSAYMPTTQEHQDKQSIADCLLSNLLQSQTSSQYADWIVTLAFYKSLHAVDSYLATKCIHPGMHTNKQNTGRNQYVRKHLSAIYPQYFVLYKASITARYDAYTHKPQEVTKLVNHSLDIEKHINTLLASGSTP